EPPQTRHFGTLCPEVSGASALYLRHRCLSLLFLIFLPVRQAQQMVNVCLDRHGRPHFLLRFPVLGVQFLFPCCQSAALFFQRVHFRQLCPAQQFVHGSLRRSVIGQLRLMLGQILPAVPGRLVPIEYGASFGVPHHRAHQFGGVRQLRLGGPQFIREPVKAVHRSIRFCTQRGIVRKLPLPEELQRGGHLLDVVDLGPSLIGRAFSLPKPLLNVHDQAHAPGRWGGILRSRDRTLPGDDRPDVLGIVTVPEGGCPEPGRFLLSRHKKGDRAAPSP
ncbi:IrrE N-terminal-like domain-containing protein, partial [Dysosmobacter welbionis]